jgi:outer membrane protein TolC
LHRRQGSRAAVGGTIAAAMLAATVSPPAIAQWRAAGPGEILTLDAAVAAALATNPKLENAALEVKKATDGVEVAKTHRYPSFQFDALTSHNLASQAYTFEEGVFGTYPIIGPIPGTTTQISSQSGLTTLFSASVSQPLLQLYKLNLIVDHHQVQQSMSQEQLRAERQSLIKEVKQQYYEILKWQSSLEATEESIAFYRELVVLVDRYVAEKVALAYQALEARARLARTEPRARSERNSLKTQMERLNSLIGRDVGTPYRVNVGVAPDAGSPPPAAAEALALAQRPEVAHARLKLQQAEVGYQIKQSDYIPDLNFVMRYSRLGNVSFIPSEVWTVGLEFRWEFYDWGRKSTQLESHQASVRQARNGIREAEYQVLVEVDAHLRQLEEARSYIAVTELGQAASREKLRVVMNQYKERAVLLTDVLQAESELADANSEHQKALLAMFTARAQLDKTLGMD